MKRTASIDLLRGLIMIFMAIDHSSALVARKHFTEMWGPVAETYPDLAWWFTRFISHLCAPGFFLLMGMSVVLFAQKRISSGWSARQIRAYFFKRGAMILAFMFFLEFPAWGLGFSFGQVEAEGGPPMPGSGGSGFLIPTTVLYGLGTCLMLCGLLWRLGKGWLATITVASFGLSAYYIATSATTDSFYFWEHFLLIPGMGNGAMVIYPVFPWLGIATFGMLWAKFYLERGEQVFKWTWQLGFAFILLALGLRFALLGNHEQDNYNDWISFFTLVKYPASVVFSLFTVGVNMMLLAAFHYIGNRPWLEPVRLFGQTAMFFYIIHLWFFALTGIPFPLGTPLYLMYILWAAALIPLYYMCRWFLKFKNGKPLNSLWRMV